MSDDIISRQAVIDVINALHEKPNAWLDSAVDAVMALPSTQSEKCTENERKTYECDLISRQAVIDKLKREEKIFYSPAGLNYLIRAVRDLPSEQPDDWIEKNKERILQAGMEGREIEFRIDGRLFAIREKAQ